MLARQSRLILAHATPILIAQLASMGMMVIDTVLLGHYETDDLAAIAVGGGIYISIVFALSGILQAVAPIVAHLHGSRRDGEIAAVLQQASWLALLLALPGMCLLWHPDPLLALADLDLVVDRKVRSYLVLLAAGLPAFLLYRTFHAFANALGRPRPLLLIGLMCTLLHAALAWLLVTGRWGGEALGVLGCGVSNVFVAWISLSCAVVFLRFAPSMARYAVFAHWQRLRCGPLYELLRLGLPIGCSSFVEISSFTFMALFIAQLGATVVAGHRIVASLAAICYMLPLALAIATLTQVGRAVGARDWRLAESSIVAGMLLAGTLSVLLGGLLWGIAGTVVAAYSDDPAVQEVASMLIAYVALYQLFDAVQTIAAHALRGYKITLLPMWIHVGCFWGVGLLGGWWLAFHGRQPLGAAGFWLASVLSLILAALLLGGMLWRVVRASRPP